MKMLCKPLVAKSLAWLSGVLMLLVICPPLVGAVQPPAMLAAPTATAAAAQSLAATAPKEIDAGANALAAQQQAVTERLRAVESAVLDAQRKSIDWWFAALAILTTVVAALGALLPYLMGRKDKELLQAELQHARDLVASIKDHQRSAERISNQLTSSYVRGVAATREQARKIGEEAASIVNNPKASEVDKLRSRAVIASQVDNPNTEQLHHAYDLWKALTVLVNGDSAAEFNAGYSAHELAKQSAEPGASYWRGLEMRHYARALALDTNQHPAANNWGSVLDQEALALLEAGDLVGARTLWKRAGEKFAQALAIKPDMHMAAGNWGNTLAREALALRLSGDLAGADALLKQAGELLHRHRRMDEKGCQEVAFNLVGLYALQGIAAKAVTQLEFCRANGVLPAYWREVENIDDLRKSTEYQSWVTAHFPN